MGAFFPTVGRFFFDSLATIGRLGSFFSAVLWHCVTPPFFFKMTLRQLITIGYFSLPVVGLTAIFTGMVLALQSYVGFSRFSAEGAIPSIVVLTMTRELGPVLAGLMVAGRVGASIAAEIGTMKVTEQIDALVTLSVNPFKYLIVPRIIAGVISLPLMVLIADTIGVFGGYLVSTVSLDFNPSLYLVNTWNFLEVSDVTSGLIKAAVFGFLITMMGCYHGYYSEGGAQGVGQATTLSVVSSSVLILFSNYILTGFFFSR